MTYELIILFIGVSLGSSGDIAAGSFKDYDQCVIEGQRITEGFRIYLPETDARKIEFACKRWS